ncbi:putative ankyrin repeat-containing domain-containing protein [Helianthus anomalus]
MCSGIEVKKLALLFTTSITDYKANKMVIEGFKWSIEKDPSSIDEVGLWYVRKKGSKQIVLEHRTPLMVASTYGNKSVLKLVVSQPKGDVNFTCGPDKCTALHCVASGGSVDVVEVIKLLLSMGADPNIEDANGHQLVDVINVPPKSSDVILTINSSDHPEVHYQIDPFHQAQEHQSLTLNPQEPVRQASSSKGNQPQAPHPTVRFSL